MLRALNVRKAILGVGLSTLSACAPSIHSAKNSCSITSWWDGNHANSSTAYDIFSTNNGTLSSSTIGSDSQGNYFTFGARLSSIQIPSSTGLNSTSALSVSAWVYPAYGIQNPVTTTLVGKGDFNSSVVTANVSSFDLSTLNASAAGYASAIFDGRYVYIPPVGATYLARYDTTNTAAFGSSGSAWSLMDITTLNASFGFFRGAVFDGRYLYLVPLINTSSTYIGQVVRYDTQSTLGFTNTASYLVYDLSTINASLVGFGGGTFDGRYMYLIPYQNNAGTLMARYDTQSTLGFANSGSWTTFNITNVNAGAAGYFGGIFDGRYMYFTPRKGDTSGLVLRYDTTSTLPFNTSTASWASFDLSTLNVHALGYIGGAFDGRYIYLSGYNSGNYGLIARYDTTNTGAFASSGSSWGIYDMTGSNAQAKGYEGGVFDGRYFYAIPFYNNSMSSYSGLLGVYDTTSTVPFATSGSAWQIYNIGTNNNGYALQGGAFDGRYVYLAPQNLLAGPYSGVIERIDTQASGNSFQLNASSTSGDGLSNSSLGPSFQINTSAGRYQVVSPSALTAAWHLVTGTYDGSFVKLYVDGTLIGSNATSGTLNTNSLNLTIGKQGSGTASLYGSTNEVQYYPVALNLSQVQALYSAGHEGGLCQ